MEDFAPGRVGLSADDIESLQSIPPLTAAFVDMDEQKGGTKTEELVMPPLPPQLMKPASERLFSEPVGMFSQK
jgi:hypothetical protein